MAADQDQKDYQDYVDYQNYLASQRGAAPAAIATPQASPAPEAQPPKSTVQTIKNYLAQTMGGLGKLADIPSTLMRGAMAAGWEASGQKPVMTGSEFLHGINPFEMTRAPDLSEMVRRAGIGNPQLSDILPGYGPAGSGRTFGWPEKGGKLDPTAAGVTQFITDPVNLLSMGAKTGAKALLDESAVRQAANPPGVLDQLTQMVGKPAQAAVDAIPGAQTAARAATAPSDILGALGRRFYRSTLQPVEYQGQKFGKADVAGTLYDTGVVSPGGLRKKADAITGKLMDARDQILSDADAAGGTPSMVTAVAPTQARIAQIRATRDPNLQPVADALEAKVREYLDLEKGTPATPARTVESPSSIMGTDGKPLTTQTVIPGTPEVAPRLVKPSESSGFKSSLYNSLPNTAYDNAIKTPAGAGLQKTLASGMRQETEDSVARSLGAGSAQDLKDLNDASGKLLSTRRAQVTVQNQADRQLDRTLSPTGTDAVLMGVGEGGGQAGTGLKMMAVKHLMDALRIATMPAGYAMQKIAENPATATLFNASVYQKLKNMADAQSKGGPVSPYAQPQENP